MLWRDAKQAFIRDGISDGDTLIVSDLSTPIQGMDVSTGQGKKKNTMNTAKE